MSVTVRVADADPMTSIAAGAWAGRRQAFKEGTRERSGTGCCAVYDDLGGAEEPGRLRSPAGAAVWTSGAVRGRDGMIRRWGGAELYRMRCCQACSKE